MLRSRTSVLVILSTLSILSLGPANAASGMGPAATKDCVRTHSCTPRAGSAGEWNIGQPYTCLDNAACRATTRTRRAPH